LDRFFFGNSGAEAVEAALKLARQATGRANLISFRGAFHGRTVGALSVTTSSAHYRAGYQPLMAGVHVAPYPYAYQYGWTEEETSAFCLEEIERMLATQTAPQDTAAMLIEPVLGEGGYVPAPPGFLAGLRQICDEHGILLLIDEVQSCFGRTGRWFAHEHDGVVPDILIMAKAMASGLPLSGIAAREEVMAAWKPGAHGGTYGGNAVSCAAAVATIQVMREEKLVENSAEQGAYLLAGLRALQAEYPAIGDVRGRGLMIGTEFSAEDGRPDEATAQNVWSRCLELGLLLLTCGTQHNVIRWIPPLIVDRRGVEQALAIFQTALAEAGA
jgi:4-aminobutyrate aminotransferase